MTIARERPLSPDALLVAANTLVGFVDVRPRSRGHMLELMLRQVHGAIDDPWAAAFIHHVGFWSHFEPASGRSVWPMPSSPSFDQLWRAADFQGVGHRDRPARGEIFLLWSQTERRFSHGGIVVAARAPGVLETGEACVECETIEGNVDETGRTGGSGVHRIRRRISTERGDRFVRWVDLDSRGLPAEDRQAGEIEEARMLRAQHAA